MTNLYDRLAESNRQAAAVAIAEAAEAADSPAGCATASDVTAAAVSVRQRERQRERRLLLEQEAAADAPDPVRLERIRELSTESTGSDPLKERFKDDATSISFVFEDVAPSREWLFTGKIPAHESGLVVAQGGAGKGFTQLYMAVALALGMEHGPFQAATARGSVIVSVEEERAEIHRRLQATLNALFGVARPGEGWRRDLAKVLTERIRFVSLKGLTGIHLGPALRDQIARTAERVREPGLIVLDPLGRMLPEEIEDSLNGQIAGGIVLNELDALRDATGAAPLMTYHASKQAIRDGAQLRTGASSGSQQLEDLARWVLGLKPLTSEEARNFGLAPGPSYVQAGLTKGNYGPPTEAPIVFQRMEGGALLPVEAQQAAQVAEDLALAELAKARAWTTREQWETRCMDSGLAKAKARDARKRLLDAGLVVTVEVGPRAKRFFAPCLDARPSGWPNPPEDA